MPEKINDAATFTCPGQQPVGDGAGVHDIRGRDKQRHGKQDKTVIQTPEGLFGSQCDVLPADCQID
jgi:hypothetical protein